jgi:hypothetical protein
MALALCLTLTANRHGLIGGAMINAAALVVLVRRRRKFAVRADICA